MNYAQLRNLLEPLVTGLKDAGTHPMLPTLCEESGLPAPAAGGSKRERMTSSFDAVTDTDPPAVARKLLVRHPPNATTRNQIQEILWSDSACPPIPKRYRREVARRLSSEDLYGDARKFDDLLERLWILDADDWMHLLGGKPTGLRAEIQQHVHRNLEDWPAETLFDQLGAYDASDRRFALFPIDNDGLRWHDLQEWWGDTQQMADATQAKRTLYRRLKDSLPRNSPPQSLLFDAFFEGFGSAVPNPPALLPEVWLHWDPRAIKERGPDALLRFRMDFLLLLPQGVRVVIEVDGKHHYADAGGSADVQRYAQMVRADRELKLAGYEVFRFGAAELQASTARADVKAFFEALFNRYGVPTS